MKKVDTEIRHVTRVGANLFAELGFDDHLALEYSAQSRQQINELLELEKRMKCNSDSNAMSDQAQNHSGNEPFKHIRVATDS